MGRPAAIFDLDGTILAHTSAERLFVAAALRSGQLEPWRAARGVAIAILDRARGRTRTLSESKAWLRGADCAPLETLGVECVHSAVRPRLRASLLCVLDAHRQRGDAIVLMTGTLDFLGTAVAQLLAAEFAVTARLERSSGRFTGHVLPPHPHGAGKVEALRALADSAQIDLRRSHAYANRASDALHLACVGVAHAVAPDAGLRRLAAARGWEVIED
jgi:HAD superfamily hydrolase (TIGR01490 family)